MRKLLKDQQVGLDTHFNYRGTSQTRIETFSDAAFAFAITLLVLSSSVPETFEELRSSMRMVVPFGISVTLLAVIWYQHYVFFLKYGLQDIIVVSLNTLLIFLVLIYAYPLKFLSRFLFELFSSIVLDDYSIVGSIFGELSTSNMRFLMVIYGLGAAFIFFVMAIMYRYAYLRRADLNLDPYELFVTKTSLVANVLMGSVPLLSVLFSLINFGHPSVTFSIAGFTYFLYPVLMPLYGVLTSRKMKKRFPEKFGK